VLGLAPPAPHLGGPLVAAPQQDLFAEPEVAVERVARGHLGVGPLAGPRRPPAPTFSKHQAGGIPLKQSGLVNRSPRAEPDMLKAYFERHEAGPTSWLRSLRASRPACDGVAHNCPSVILRMIWLSTGSARNLARLLISAPPSTWGLADAACHVIETRFKPSLIVLHGIL